MRASDLNRQRKLQFGQAVMLGVELKHEKRRHGMLTDKMVWYKTHTSDLLKNGYINGPFNTRHEAVTSALRDLDVIPEPYGVTPLPDGAIFETSPTGRLIPVNTDSKVFPAGLRWNSQNYRHGNRASGSGRSN